MRLALIAILLTPLAACTSTHVRLVYTPSPSEVLVSSTEQEPQARVLVSVRAAERRDRDPRQPFELHLRMRVENLVATPLALDLGELLLVDSDLRTYGAVRLDDSLELADDVLDVPAEDSAVLDLYFPLGDKQPKELEGLNLRFTLRVDGRVVVAGSNFERVREVRIYPYGPYGYNSYYGYPHGYIGFRHYYCY